MCIRDRKYGEGLDKDHGWVFEVPATATGLVDPKPLVAMGRFNHEAACVDPATGFVYLTEDRTDSVLYRFIPRVPGELSQGGRLQATSLRELARDSGNKTIKDTVSAVLCQVDETGRRIHTGGFVIKATHCHQWLGIDQTSGRRRHLKYPTVILV